ncbi:MAG: PKD domain-containing protein [Bacteroidales bacterium]
MRDVSTGRYPLEVGPENHSQIWWAMGHDNNDLANRPCMLNDEWTFYRDGKMEFRTQGDYWAEGGMFEPENICNSTSQMVGKNGEDLSAWGDGNHTFELTVGNPSKIKAIGKGAYIGFFKLGNGTEVKVPQDFVEYNIVKLYDGTVDTLIVEGIYRWDPNSEGGYWRFVLVHYDNPADEPPIPGPSPEAGFTYTMSGLTVTFTNTTTNGETYLWDFGDGTTSTEANPVHTYAHDDIYMVTLTASNPNGQGSSTKQLFVSATPVTEAVLKGGPWRPRAEALSIFVGPGLGDYSWWSVPKNFLDGSSTGADDWSCITDDEFTFADGGVFIYNTNGSARNDGYMGSPNGCWSDEQIAASGNGAAFGSGVHSWQLVTGNNGRPRIILTNGLTGAAFLGFYKGYYGGENMNGSNPPNGGNLTNEYEVMGYANTGSKEYLFISVDITPDHSGGAAWSVILVR